MRRLTAAGLDVVVAGGEDREGGGDGPLVVLCHGFGAPGEDLVPLFRQLSVPREVRFAFPAAPLDLGATLGPAYRGGRAWWMIDPKSLEEAQRGVRRDRSHVVPEGLVEARGMVTELLGELGRLLTAPPERTISDTPDSRSGAACSRTASWEAASTTTSGPAASSALRSST